MTDRKRQKRQGAKKAKAAWRTPKPLIARGA